MKLAKKIIEATIVTQFKMATKKATEDEFKKAMKKEFSDKEFSFVKGKTNLPTIKVDLMLIKNKKFDMIMDKFKLQADI